VQLDHLHRQNQASHKKAQSNLCGVYFPYPHLTALNSQIFWYSCFRFLVLPRNTKSSIGFWHRKGAAIPAEVRLRPTCELLNGATDLAACACDLRQSLLLPTYFGGLSFFLWIVLIYTLWNCPILRHFNSCKR